MASFRFRKPVLSSYRMRTHPRFIIAVFIMLVTLTCFHLTDHPGVNDYVARITHQAHERLHPHYAPETSKLPEQALWQAPADGGGIAAPGAAVNGSHVADYLNFLVDRYQLSSDLSWYARRIQPQFSGGAAAAVAAKKPEGRRPGRLSLTRMSDHFMHGVGFVAAHAPGQKALKAQVDRLAHLWKEEEERAATAASASASSSVVSLPTAVVASLLDDAAVMTPLPLPVVGGEEPTAKNSRSRSRNRNCDVLRLPMGRSPRPDEIDATMLLFGISTTYARLQFADFALLDDWARWLTDGGGHSNGATLFLSLHKPRRGEPAIVRSLLTARGIDFHLHVDQGDPWEGENGEYSMLKDEDGKSSWANDDDDDNDNDSTRVPPPSPADDPVIPDPAVQRYSNLLPALCAYSLKARHMALDPAEYQAFPPKKKFYALVEDDVFFPNMDKLLQKLREQIEQAAMTDKTRPYPPTAAAAAAAEIIWVGFPSDARSDWVFVNASAPAHELTGLSHGGSAVFLSPQIAHHLLRDPCLQKPDGTSGSLAGPLQLESIDRSPYTPAFDSVAAAFVTRGGGAGATGAAWDTHLYRCLAQHQPDAVLRLVPSFFAPSDVALYTSYRDHHDVAADAQLVGRLHQYAGGTQPLALHNYRAWHGFHAGAGHRVASVCGEACFLQRFAFGDDWVLVNGHSLVKYAPGALRPVAVHRAGTTSTRNTGRHGLPQPVPDRRSGFFAADPDYIKTSNDEPGRRGFFATLLDKCVGGDRARGLPPPAERDRRYALQQLFWNIHHVAVEEPERPDDLQILAPAPRGSRQTWKLLDAQTAADGSVLQAYVRRRRTVQQQQQQQQQIKQQQPALAAWASPARNAPKPHGPPVLDVGGNDAQTLAEEAEVEADEDSVIVLIWEKPDEETHGGQEHLVAE